MIRKMSSATARPGFEPRVAPARAPRRLTALWLAVRPEPGYRRLSLYARVVLVNAAVLVTASLVLALTPATVSFPLALREAVVLGVGVTVIVIANAVLLRVSFRPLGRLADAMGAIDLLKPGSRLRISGGTEVRQVIQGFNQMLDRLERERQESNRRAIVTREGERRRIGHELHDEIGQRLTAILLQLERTIAHAPPGRRDELTQVQELARSTLDEIGRIAWQLRPAILDDLGLVPALQALVDAVPQGRPQVDLRLDASVPRLDAQTELAVYRVAQEGLTNALRHAQASHVVIGLGIIGDQRIRLSVSDDGRGLRPTDVEGPGMRGMRERALLIGAALRIESTPNAGVRILLDLAPPPED
jgi:two-component system sensor histidine kinase UhpB